MSNVRFLKGVRTRYRNSIQTEILNGKQILSSEVDKIDEQRFVLEATKCADKLKMYSEKLEIQSGKLASALKDEGEVIDDIVGEDCELCSNVMDCYLDLIQFKERLVDFIKKESIEVKENEFSSQIVELQREMKDIMQSQMQQQHEIFKKQSINEKENSTCSIKLPKLDLPFFNGEKIKWMEFWDSFQSSVHSNTKLTDIEKFNYLWSKLQGEAKRAVSGLTLSSDNYSLAINILQERFGNKQDKFKKGAKAKWKISSLCEKLQDYVVAREKSDKTETEKDRSNSQRSFNGSFNSHKPWQNKNGKQNGNFRSGTQNRNINSAEALVASTERNVSYFDKCRYCQEQHWSDECKKFQSVEDRKRQLKGCCFKCLRYGHKSIDCKKGKLCVHCGEKNSHHRSLCPKKFKMKMTSVHLSEENSHSSIEELRRQEEFSVNMESNEDPTENMLVSSSEMVLMQTAKTDVVNPKNKEKVETRILFDSGSQRTYISQSLASKLKLKGDKEEELKLVTFGSEKPKIVKTSSTNLSIKLNNGKNFNLVANIVPVISGCVHRKSLDASTMEHLKHFVKEVELADELPFQNESSSIELLIGNDYYLDLILSNKVEIQPGLYLLASKLGWIVTGRTRETYEEKSETGLLILSNTSSFEISDIENPDQSIVAQAGICDLWNLESIGIIENMETSSDKKAMEYFKETLKFKNGRYYVKWPWKENTPELPDNRELALGRLKSCVARMRKKPDLLTKYDTIIQDQIQKGIVEEVNEFRTDGRKHYIPHHAVITPQKSTTKVRIVYDASAKNNKEMPSLNECLYRGPVLLNNLCGIFMRFRLHKIAMVADIEKAFLQVGLQEDDRDVTRFMWLKDCANTYVERQNTGIQIL
ncbi:Hypothetical predicted protein [Mytilus galloprovincialis]|uniref:CCHC-type domain-containing protein n=1 Tax=Mytilus galloprovincialis TaxID=29158 RepID=A0A8B6H270_MYTGA|nr:Hypothetical predicted protein [Mytilus galloprovincialis]